MESDCSNDSYLLRNFSRVPRIFVQWFIARSPFTAHLSTKASVATIWKYYTESEILVDSWAIFFMHCRLPRWSWSMHKKERLADPTSRFRQPRGQWRNGDWDNKENGLFCRQYARVPRNPTRHGSKRVDITRCNEFWVCLCFGETEESCRLAGMGSRIMGTADRLMVCMFGLMDLVAIEFGILEMFVMIW